MFILTRWKKPPDTNIHFPHWKLESKHTISLSRLEPDPLVRMIDNTQWIDHDHPYCDLPELKCHIPLPYVVVKAGPKCIGLDLDQIAFDYHHPKTSDSQRVLKGQLELLRDRELDLVATTII